MTCNNDKGCAMSVTQHTGNTAVPLEPPRLTWQEMIRLGALSLAFDVRDRRRDPGLRKRPALSALDPRLHRPIFIVGAPRSGTTFLGSCIGRMPEVSYHFEPRLTKAAAGCVYDESWSWHRGATVFRLTYSTLLLAALHGGRRFAEKTPENSFVIPFLAQTMPGAQFIHILRDGRDNAVSHAEKPWLAAATAGQRVRSGPMKGPRPRWWVEQDRREEFVTAPDLVRAAWAWRRFTEAALEGMATLPAERAVEVRYESVVSDPGGTADLLAKFLDTSTEGRDALHKGLARARPDSVGRWEQKLSGRDLADVVNEIGPLLGRVGYA